MACHNKSDGEFSSFKINKLLLQLKCKIISENDQRAN